MAAKDFKTMTSEDFKTMTSEDFKTVTSEDFKTLNSNVQEDIINAYLDAVLQAFQERANAYCANTGADLRKKFLRVMDVKNALKSIGSPATFGIGADMDYSQCMPPGVCTGGNCIRPGAALADEQLVNLATALGVEPKDLFVH